MLKVGIINLGSNNLYSIYNSCIVSGLKPKIISHKEKKLNYDLVIIPGVGAFKSGMKIINKYGYDEKFFNYLNKPKSFLYGICLGMQLLFSKSEEFGNTKGLNFFKGSVKKISNLENIKTNIGWCEVKINKKNLIPKKNFINERYFYFIHSYCVNPLNEKDIFATSFHQNKKFVSMVKYKNIFGTQFHPEKSGKDGILFLKNIKNFLI
jgi:imidazole glycerol-phosphate synthase subunit HisH